jgi:RimJ/RimL family protein N-acetyltransferase
MEIMSERLILKELSLKHLDFIYKMERNYLVYQYEEAEEPNKEQTYKKYIDKIGEMEKAQGKSLIFLICILPDETPVGEVHIKLNWEEIREWEVGYTLHPDYWGNGYASEAVKVVLKHVFDNLNAHKVVGFCNANNKKSANLLERVGMKRDGILREGKLWSNEWCDEYVYSILEKDYLALNEFKETLKKSL